MKIRKRFMQIVSYILVFVMLLELVPPSVVSAEPTETEILRLLWKALEDEEEEDREEIEEAVRDSYAVNKAGNWWQACIMSLQLFCFRDIFRKGKDYEENLDKGTGICVGSYHVFECC